MTLTEIRRAAQNGGVPARVHVQVEGAVYALEAASGRLLWRRYVGYGSAAPPTIVEHDVLVTDSAHNDLLRVVDGELPTRVSHQIAEDVSQSLRKAVPRLATATVHVDPVAHAGQHPRTGGDG